MSASFRVLLNNQPADAELQARFSRVRVDQVMGMAWEAELHLPVGLDSNGNWSALDEAFAQPLARVRVEVKIEGDEFTPLIDGTVVGQRFELSARPNESTLVLVVHDDSVGLNRDEAVQVFEEQSASDIASQLFSDNGLEADVDNVEMPAGGLERYIVQRGTPMALLRQLARRHGMWVYVRPAEEAGSPAVGMFKRPELEGNGLPDILVVGSGRNCKQFTAEFDALRPATAKADSVGIMDIEQRTGESDGGDVQPLGDEGVHDLVEPGRTLLARTRETESDLSAAARSATDLSAWAYNAQGEVSSGGYAGVLSPYRTVNVGGAGGYLTGRWLISRVTHELVDSGYRQQFVLRRNARAASSVSGSSSVPGGIF